MIDVALCIFLLIVGTAAGSLITLAILWRLLMATLADIQADLTQINSNVAALQANQQPPGQQAQIDAIKAQTAALVTASTPPTPVPA